MHLAWPFCRLFLKTIQLVLRSSNLSNAPPEVLTIFNEMDSNVWTSTTAEPLSSAYMIHQLPDRLSLDGSQGIDWSQITDSECVEDIINTLDRVSIV